MNPAAVPGPGKLSLVATPIGNLEDITLRALRVLKEADVIAAEDTRRTGKLLSHYRIPTPVISYYKDVERRRLAPLLHKLHSGQKVALVTDAGTPAVSDPGALLVGEARRQGIPVEVVPGPSALLAALAGSGISGPAFSFHGFLEARSSARRRQLQALKDRPEILVFFLSPHRLPETLRDAEEALGEGRPAVLCREMTKRFEEYAGGTLAELRTSAEKLEPRGEYTLVVSGATASPAECRPESLEDHLARLQAEGCSLNQAVASAARERGLNRREVYALAHSSRRINKSLKKQPDLQ